MGAYGFRRSAFPTEISLTEGDGNTCSWGTVEGFGDSTVCCYLTFWDLAAEVVDGLLEGSRCLHAFCFRLLDDLRGLGHANGFDE